MNRILRTGKIWTKRERERERQDNRRKKKKSHSKRYIHKYNTIAQQLGIVDSVLRTCNSIYEQALGLDESLQESVVINKNSNNNNEVGYKISTKQERYKVSKMIFYSQHYQPMSVAHLEAPDRLQVADIYSSQLSG